MLDFFHIVIVYAVFLGSLILLLDIDFLAGNLGRCESLEFLTLLKLFFIHIPINIQINRFHSQGRVFAFKEI
jgi:hypothetical protein